MKHNHLFLLPLQSEDREQFITDNQRAFLYGATEEFGLRDDHFEEDGQIISRKTIEASLDRSGAEAYRIVSDGQKVGGVILHINPQTNHNHLEILFVHPDAHSKRIGQAAWKAIEALHPETVVWETFTPYFETRNIHFYVNRCGFHIVEYFHKGHPMLVELEDDNTGEDFDGMFRFEKRMKEANTREERSNGA